MKTKKSIFFILFILVSIIFAKYPSPVGWVNDFAGIINENTKAELETLITELEQKTKAEVAVVTFKELPEQKDIEMVAVELFQEWGVGKKELNNGVLLIVSLKERAIRIEVGYGLEEILPDGLCGEIIRRYIIPEFRKGDYSLGIKNGVIILANIIAKNIGVELDNKIAKSVEKLEYKVIAFQILFFTLLLIIILRYPLLWLLLPSARIRWYGGGFGGFGGGYFGGFNGFGGGMSGGGGATGRW